MPCPMSCVAGHQAAAFCTACGDKFSAVAAASTATTGAVCQIVQQHVSVRCASYVYGVWSWTRLPCTVKPHSQAMAMVVSSASLIAVFVLCLRVHPSSCSRLPAKAVDPPPTASSLFGQHWCVERLLRLVGAHMFVFLFQTLRGCGGPLLLCSPCVSVSGSCLRCGVLLPSGRCGCGQRCVCGTYRVGFRTELASVPPPPHPCPALCFLVHCPVH